jgi:formylglycine-generating enzyme required for sulfatase activity
LNNAGKQPENTAEPIVVPDQGPGSIQTRPKDGMLMVYIPAGEFTMGSDVNNNDEKPAHKVNLDGFWIDQTEVTNAMYAQFLNEKGNQSQSGVNWLDDKDADVRIHKSGSRWQAELIYANHPVVEVSWYGASAYCTWAGGRLPTEAEWEKAARGTDQRTYPWGNNPAECAYANYTGCFNSIRAAGLLPAGVSPYGILDMAGNAWEWVADWYGQDYYTSSPIDNPTGPVSGNARILRGGSWQYEDSFIRTTHRYKSAPETTNDYIGFRCVLPQD